MVGENKEGVEPTEDIELLLSAKDVARILRCSVPLVYRMAERGQIACVRWAMQGEGKPKLMLRFRREDVLGFIEGHYREEAS